MTEVLRDVAYTLRQWRTRTGRPPLWQSLLWPMGIGANAAIFSAVHGILLQPLPYPDPDRLAVVSLSWPEGPLLALGAGGLNAPGTVNAV